MTVYTELLTLPDLSLPVAFDLVTKAETYLDPKTGNEKRRSILTKNERFRMLLRISAHNEIPFSYLLADSWYASAGDMKFIVLRLKKHFVLPLKENRKVAVSEAEQQQCRFVAVETLALPECETRQIWLEDVPFALLVTKDVFTNKDGSQGVRYLVTDDLTLSYDQTLKLYQRRWRETDVVPFV